ncbi:hypothetical protein CROQUDRAFT_86795 [Cronartium quercuum f. sp. fusiforme G11]|uniref:Uncharacterized protein n=1 Tax=Cronartium quercuum f. sp. fusiforme G11 TaxID=708437 RepID=A0A9P6TGU1_9BASI|nr:hypothetical protein CROQUDRAFT_86795 [Cronartium quercuum f. sp. fusiforme G11]
MAIEIGVRVTSQKPSSSSSGSSEVSGSDSVVVAWIISVSVGIGVLLSVVLKYYPVGSLYSRTLAKSPAFDQAPSDRQSTVFGVGSLSRPSDGRQRRSEYRLLAYQLKSVMARGHGCREVSSHKRQSTRSDVGLRVRLRGNA